MSNAILVKTIDELPIALSHPSLLGLVKKVLASDEQDHIGFKTLVETLDDIVYDLLEARYENLDKEKLFSCVKRINDYTMSKLSKLLWHPNRQKNPQDVLSQE